jgi:hypothetical protein
MNWLTMDSITAADGWYFDGSVKIRKWLASVADPGPLVRGMDPDPNPSIIKQKILMFTVLFDFLSFWKIM